MGDTLHFYSFNLIYLLKNPKNKKKQQHCLLTAITKTQMKEALSSKQLNLVVKRLFSLFALGFVFSGNILAAAVDCQTLLRAEKHLTNTTITSFTFSTKKCVFSYR